MKKKSRFLTGLLSAVMALSLFALPAAATDGVAGGNGTGSENAPAITDVWGDANKKGSITIHKYEYNRPEGTTGTAAPGTVLGKDQIPSDAKELDDVEFKIYKVQSRDALADYYSGIEKQGVDYSNFTSVSKYYRDGKVYDGADKEMTAATDVHKTAKGGVASFTNLGLGLYLVVETDAPDKVTKPADPFLVSVPMRKPENQNEWLYDIHVYPKNETTYGKVEIVKHGITGNDAAVNLKDVTFKLEKKTGTDAESNDVWTLVTGPEDGSKGFNLTTDSDGKISISGLSKGTYRFVEVSGNGEGYILSEEPIEFTINDKGKLVYDGQVKTDAIVVENYRPDLDKQVYNNTLGDYEEGADYSVGDKVPYQITVKVPQNIIKLETFTVTDTPVNLKDDTSTITITTKDKNGDDVAVEESAYTIEEQKTGEDGFTIKFHPDKMKDYAGKTLVISYKAELLDTANRITDGNTNNAKLTYTNKIDKGGKGYKDSQNTIEDETVVYTFAIRIKKTKEDGKTALPGAKFDLYKDVTGELTDEQKTTLPANVITDTNASALGLDGTHYWKKVDTGLTSDENGLVTTSDKKGLANGTYYLVETEAPKGYNLLSKPVEVKLNVAYKYSWKVSNTYDQDGNLKKNETSQKKETFNPNEATSADDKIIGTDKSDATDIGVKLITVINRKGFDLPTTGGFGTLLFSGIGALLVVGGVGVLMSTKKKKGNT